MSWIIPPNKMNREMIESVSCIPKQNLCITGFSRTGKRIAICHLLCKIILSEADASCIMLVRNKLNADLYQSAFNELGFHCDVKTYFWFKNNSQTYDYIFCDNVQNISPSTLTDIKNRAKYVIITINPYITLFEKEPLTDQRTVTISDIETILAPKLYEFDYPYRSDLYLQRIVSNIIKPNSFQYNNVDDIFSKIRAQIRLCKGINEEEEFIYIIREAKRSLNCGYSNAILLPTNNMILSFLQKVISLEGKDPWSVQTNRWGKINYPSLNQHLEKNNIPFQCLGNTYGHIGDCQNKISVLTYHSSEGLHFDDVFIPYMNTKLFINSNEYISRTALAIAMSRWDYNLFITFSGILHEFLAEIETDCNKIDIHEALATPLTNNLFTNL